MQPLSVSAINDQIKALLEATFVQVCVSGEVSNCTHHSSGHLYFTIKDKDSTLRCVMFRGNLSRLKFQIKEGMDLILDGTISVYKPKGEYSLNCINASPNGIGALNLAFEQLKESYQKKGYFNRDLKKQLPKFPKKVALLTSSTGAVLHDMLRIAKKRWNLVEFVLINTLVQGEGAKESIAKNIEIADSLGFDCIILARGGGSLEDLWAFNEPLVVESVFNAKTPIISAIGHEPDIVLSDFVADLRAPTPSAAIEMLLPDSNEWLLNLANLQSALESQMQGFLKRKEGKIKESFLLLNRNTLSNKIDFLSKKLRQESFLLEGKMEHKLQCLDLRLNALNEKLQLSLKQKLITLNLKLESLKAQLEAKKYTQKEGFVCALNNGKKIKSLKTIKEGEILELQDTSATLKAKVIETTLH